MTDQLLQYANRIVICDGGFNFLIKYYEQIKNKNIFSIGDMDSISQENIEFIKNNKNITFLHDSDQNTTDSQKALNFLYNYYQKQNQKQPQTILVSAFGGRLDHQLYNIGLIYKEIKFRNHQVIGLDSFNCQTIINGNINYHIQVPDNQQQTIGVLPVDKSIICTTKGLSWDLDKTELKFDGLLSSCNSCNDKQKGFDIYSSDYTQIMVSGQF